MPEVLIHICCAPCSIMPLRYLVEAGNTVTAYFDNPNIEPDEEYRRRRDTFLDYAADIAVPVVEGIYDPERWHQAIGADAGVFPLIEHDPQYFERRQQRENRCRACYRLRFGRLAECACDRGSEFIATSLSISPWQFTEIIAQELEQAAQQWSIQALFADYRCDYSEATRISRELGMYRQNYCGCAFSKQEAQLERAARKKSQ